MTKFLTRVLLHSEILKDEKERGKVFSASNNHPLLKGAPFLQILDPVKGQSDMGDLVLAIDILLVFTNIEEFEKKVKFDADLLELYMTLVRNLVPEEIKDKVDVILCFYCKINSFGDK